MILSIIVSMSRDRKPRKVASLTSYCRVTRYQIEWWQDQPLGMRYFVMAILLAGAPGDQVHSAWPRHKSAIPISAKGTRERMKCNSYISLRNKRGTEV